MKKQGFTLIELMVVIVIMGILAAVAVPKLFAMIAKSKASEVGPAAGTYVHMEDAYASEAAKLGDFTAIGYSIPASNVFTYTCESCADAGATFTATPKAALDGISDAWTVESSLDGSGNTSHNAQMPEGAEKLTPNFSAIGRTATTTTGG